MSGANGNGRIVSPLEGDASLDARIAERFANRTVLVTGADGFVGSHLTERLVALGADVHVFCRATSSGALNNIAHLRDGVRVHWGDLADKHAVDRAVAALRGAWEPPYVFHLGAQAHVGESWERPYETVVANTIGTLNLLQAIVDHNLEVEKVDTAGTSEEYGNPREAQREQYRLNGDGYLLDEVSPVNPTSIYATSKLAADFLTMNYHEAYGVPGVVTRMFNNYGPRQNPRYVTGTIITQALLREEVELGALDPKRDFCFVEDGVRGHLAVAAFGTPGEVYCYGQGEQITMGDWAELILRVGREHGFWGERRVVSVAGRFRPGASDVMSLHVNATKINLATGWRPQHSWEEGVLRTIEWYATHQDRWIGRVDWAGERSRH